jgi:hypothetical protein
MTIEALGKSSLPPAIDVRHGQLMRGMLEIVR